MFKVGDIVRIKSCDEVIEVNKRMSTCCPAPSTMKMHCGKTGKVTKVTRLGGSKYWIKINISHDFYWRDYEIAPMKFDNFFPLRMWV